MITRRLALFRILAGSAAATAATTATVGTVAPVEAVPESKRPFESPAEYLAALQAIGWKAAAMFQRMPDGSVLRMGINERAPNPEWMMEHWGKYHAISMRCPVQHPVDVHPDQHWWKAVWQHLYDKGLRQDVTPADQSRNGGRIQIWFEVRALPRCRSLPIVIPARETAEAWCDVPWRVRMLMSCGSQYEEREGRLRNF